MTNEAQIQKVDSLQPVIQFPKRRNTTTATTANSIITNISTNQHCRILSQYRILLWKSFLIRRRHPFLLCAEIIFPILFVTILTIFRSHQSLTLEPACHIQSQSMPSMGLLHYMQSMICNFNYTCYPEDPDHWENSENFSPLIYLLHNLTELAKDSTFREFILEPTTFKLTNIFQRTILIPKLLDLYTAGSDTMQWVSTHYPLIQSHLSLETLKNVSNIICGSESNLNDVWRVAQFFEQRQTIQDESDMSLTPTSIMDNLWAEIPMRNLSMLEPNLNPGQRKAKMLNLCEILKYLLTRKPIYHTMGRLRHFFFGKVAYYPSNSWTDSIVKQSDMISDIFKQLRQLAIYYFNTTRPWLVTYLSDPVKIDPIRQRFAECTKSNSSFLTSKIRRFCNFSFHWLTPSTNPNQNKPFFSDWPTTLDQLDFIIGIVEDLLTNCFEIDEKFVPFQNYESWLNYLNSDPSRLSSTTIGLILNSSIQSNWTNHLNKSNLSNILFTLTLRKNFPLIDGTYQYKVLDRYWNPRPRRDPQIDMKYFTSGFIDIQEQISQTLVNHFHQQIRSSTSDSSIDSQLSTIGIQMKLFPFDAYKDDKFIDFFSTSLPQLMILAWSLSVVMTVKYLVDEKEESLIAIFQTFGLSKLVNQLAWLTSSFMIMFVLVIPTLLILKYGQIIPQSNFYLMFVFVTSYLISCLGFALLLSTLFHQANLAAIWAGILYFLLYLPAPFLLRHESEFPSGLLVLASLIPQIGYSLGWSFVTRLETQGSGAQWYNLWFSGSIDDPFCLGMNIFFLWFSSFVYLLLILLVNRLTRPNSNCIAQIFNRFHTQTERPSSRIRIPNRNDHSRTDPTLSLELNQSAISDHPVQPTTSVRLVRISKYFWTNRRWALDQVSMDFYSDQITVLLGHNGAGKTTLMSILVGLIKPNRGIIQIHGQDVSKRPDSIRHLIGYCPQHDILYANLTILEHIYLFGVLKNLNMTQLKQQLDLYLDNLGLADKRHALTKTLSGGQKRKLSLFLAFMGPTSIVILDEPTAGLDPLSKLAIWDLLKSMRLGRTIILSSHHMRETEILADQIAVLTRGRLLITGSLGQLCSSHSPGYRFGLERHLSHPDFDKDDVDKILLVCCQHVPMSYLVYQYPWKLIFAVNSESAYDGSLEKLFNQLESDEFKQQYDIAHVGLINIPLDELFLDALGILSTTDSNLKEDGASNSNQHMMPNSNCQNLSSVTSEAITIRGYKRQIKALLTKRYYHLKRNKLSWIIQFIVPCLLVLNSLIFVQFFRPKVEHPPMHIHPWLVQTKRIPHLVHFYSETNDTLGQMSSVVEPYRSLFRKPYVWTGTRCLPLELYDPTPRTVWGCLPIDQFDPKFHTWPNSICSKHYSTNQNPPCRQLATNDLLINLTGFQLANHLIGNDSIQFIGRRYGGLEFDHIRNSNLNELLKKSLTIQTNHLSEQSNIWLDNLDLLKQLLPPNHILRIWYNNKGYTSAPAYLNMFHNLKLRQPIFQSDSYHSNSTYPIPLGLAVINHPLLDSQLSLIFNFRESLKSNSVIALFLLLTFSFIPTNFILPLIREHQTQSKHLQFLAGLKPYLYWSVNLGCDFLIYILCTLICLLLLIGFQKHAYIGYSTFVPFCSVIFLYGLAMIPLIYLLSFIFLHPSTGFVFICALNLLISCLTTTVSFFLKIISIQYSDIESISNVIQNLFRLFPHFCLGSTIYDLAVHDFLVGFGLRKSTSTTIWKLLWPNMIFLIFECLIFFTLVLCIEYQLILLVWHWFGKFQSQLGSGRNRGEQMTNSNSIGDALEISQSAFIQTIQPAFELDSVSKQYSSHGFKRKSKFVLSNLSFSVPYGQCFGLVGSNGAGKSTTYGILSGQIPISNGIVRMHGLDLISPTQNRLLSTPNSPSIGYCPQQDALHDFLTVRETLTMYAHFHLIPDLALPDYVTQLMEQTGLNQSANCITSTLSGGNKRKLSTAIAFLGNPDLILLDEPSNGMDLGAKRRLWARINHTLKSKKSAILLSSHYMDECELLCQTIGLLEQGKLICVGQPLDLRHQNSGNYVVRLQLNKTQLDQLGLDKFEQTLKHYLPEFRLRLPTTAQQECYCSKLLSLSQLFGLLRSIYELKLVTYFGIQQSCLEDVLNNLTKSRSTCDLPA